jgi:hypothetical protein
MSHIQPISAVTVEAFMKVYRELCPTVDDEVPIKNFATRLRWSIERTRTVAEWLDERELIDTDAGMGSPLTAIEGRY